MFEECLYFNTNALARTVTRIWAEAYKPFELSPPHAFLLRAVASQPGISPRELARKLELSRSTVTRFLDNLEARGFLERGPSGQDGRELAIQPTDKTIAIQADLDKIGARLSKKMTEYFGQKDMAELVKQLRSIRAELED